MRCFIPTMYSYKMEENFEPNIIIQPYNPNVIIEKILRRIIDSLFLLLEITFHSYYVHFLSFQIKLHIDNSFIPKIIRCIKVKYQEKITNKKAIIYAEDIRTFFKTYGLFSYNSR